MEKTIEIPEGYEARIEGNKVILEQNDESIRNFLYEFIKICGWSEKQFPPREKCLAYLEKQKEQKPEEKISVSDELYEHIRNACARIEDAMSSDTMCDMTDYLEMADKSAQAAFDMLEKHQPAEWSEEDKMLLNNAILAAQK